MRVPTGILWFFFVGLALAWGCGDDPLDDTRPVQPGGSGGSAGGEGGEGGEGGSGGVGGIGGIGGMGGIGGEGGSPFVPPVDLGEHLRFWGVDGPAWSVSADRGGNIWAANGRDLLLLRAGEESWEVLTEEDGLLPYGVLSVAGGEALEVWVGYEGLFPDDNPFDDPEEISKSGDVDRIRLLADGTLDRFHYDISSPPSDLYPDGRDVLRSCFRIVPVLEGPFRGDVWFGCNHGAAMWSAGYGQVFEHVHPAINIGTSLFTGDFRGIAVAPDGNVWVGAAARTGRIRYADFGGNFWAPIAPELDVWPEGVALDPEGHDWVMALAADEVGGLWVGSFGNGLAYRAADGSFLYLTTANGLLDNRMRDLALDPDGSLWVANEAGLLRLRGASPAQAIDASDGLPGAVVSVFVDTASSPRRVIIGTTEGVAIYDGP